MTLEKLKKFDKVHNSEYYVEFIISRTLKENKDVEFKKRVMRKDDRIIKLEKNKINTAYRKTIKFLRLLDTKFRQVYELYPIYKKLLECDDLDMDELEDNLNKLCKVASGLNKQLDIAYRKIMVTNDANTMYELRKSMFGHLSARIQRLDPIFKYLDNVRRKFKDLPDFKDDYKTVAISGFPNVGKSTLLKKLTGANPEIESFAFTTKKLNLGYYGAYQFIDTPGTLHRETMNNIERKADVVLHEIADKVIFVIDATLARPVSDHISLLNYVMSVCNDVIIYISMTDIIDDISGIEKELKKLKVSYYTDSEKLKKELK